VCSREVIDLLNWVLVMLVQNGVNEVVREMSYWKGFIVLAMLLSFHRWCNSCCSQVLCDLVKTFLCLYLLMHYVGQFHLKLPVILRCILNNFVCDWTACPQRCRNKVISLLILTCLFFSLTLQQLRYASVLFMWLLELTLCLYLQSKVFSLVLLAIFACSLWTFIHAVKRTEQLKEV